ncbi:hypothetical protein [Balneatrix alpica]|uniref:Uncharacterized protein n=1 Tax=Balneatrix alpica TaxID=75684 RepID=A0ABV5ZBM8_9GAMM|nr:hypothetical protein [Balneatrix alpica]
MNAEHPALQVHLQAQALELSRQARRQAACPPSSPGWVSTLHQFAHWQPQLERFAKRHPWLLVCAAAGLAAYCVQRPQALPVWIQQSEWLLSWLEEEEP